MLGFLKRIPGMLGLNRGAAGPAAARPKLTVIKGGEPEVKRGRGTGRGVTPPAKPKPRPGTAQRRKK